MNKSTHTLTTKLPLITLTFWIMKISATTLGETAGDLFSMTLNAGYAASTVVLMSLFLIALIFQLKSKNYHPILYWSVILLTSTAGTTMSDFMDRTLELGYMKGSLILVTSLISVLAIWKYAVGTLAVDHIKSRKAEVFYWIAILISNTLGTALGDFLADDSGLGFAGGALVIGGLLAAIVAAYYLTKINKVILFWLAFILTRPFGATIGDVLTKSTDKGGLNFGTVNSSLFLFAILAFFIVITVKNQKKQFKQSHVINA